MADKRDARSQIHPRVLHTSMQSLSGVYFVEIKPC